MTISSRRRPKNRRRFKNYLWFSRFGPVPLIPCHWCRRPLTFDQATQDHVQPRSFGGDDEPENIVLACGRCNRKRGKKSHRILQKGRQAALSNW